MQAALSVTSPISRPAMLAYVRSAGARYWPNGQAPEDHFPAHDIRLETLGRAWVEVPLPEPFQQLGVDGRLLVDAVSIQLGKAPAFEHCDWYLAAFSYLAGMAEWHHEAAHGAAHSFAFKLPQMPAACFTHAWVNRIFLLLRADAAQRAGKNEVALFGELPPAEIVITHDIDALDKTIPIRIKQTLFECFNALRWVCGGKWRAAKQAGAAALRMACSNPSYNHLDSIADMVAARGLRSRFHIYPRAAQRSVKQWFFDPGYALDDPRLTEFVARRKLEGFHFGLHPSFDTWNDAQAMQDACSAFQHALGFAPEQVRQHWLRFSWAETWQAQAKAGLKEDCTLGFNDISGFRTGCALRYAPWNMTTGAPHALQIVPLVLMDSHLYSYAGMSEEERVEKLNHLIDEVKTVHGVASVLWHPHTLSTDYGWQQGFKDLLTCITRR